MGIKTSVFIGCSTDGYIARVNGDLDWLTRDYGGKDEDYGYHQFFATVDALVMGRNTFQTVLGFESWPYEDRSVYVLTSHPQTLHIPEELTGRVLAVHDKPMEIRRRLEGEGKTHAYIDGGLTIQSFLRDGALDELCVSRAPILLGGGISLFGNLNADVDLEHIETRNFRTGFVQSRYRVKRG